MPRMFIPALDTKLRLTKDWEFSLLCEQRNQRLWDLKTGRAPMNSIPLLHRRGQAAVVQLVKGDELIIKRVYIRQGQKGFNSVTMSGMVQYEGLLRPVRFWVALSDFNKIEAEVIE